MGHKYRPTTTGDLTRLRQMAALGTVSMPEADRALGRYAGFSRRWARQLELQFPDGRTLMAQRLERDRKD